MSLRGRLLIALLVVVTLGLFISDVATYKTLRRFLVDRVDQQLDGVRRPAEASLARSALRTQANPAAPGPPVGAGLRGEVYVEVRDASGKVIGTSGSSRSLDTSVPRIPKVLPPVQPAQAPPAGSGQLGTNRTGPAVYRTVGSAGSG